MVKFFLKKFEELTLTELYQSLALRSEVFIVEQDCVYQDIDGLDQQCTHILGYVDNMLVAYARIVPKGLSYPNYVAIGRVISSKKVRGQKIGKQLFQYALDSCIRLYPEEPIKLSAQVYIKDFYNSFGFQETGDAYLEDDIPHIAMIYNVHLG